MTSSEQLTRHVAKEAIACLEYGLRKIEHCLGQLNDEQIWWRPRGNMNSIGNLLLHLTGNLRQWIVAGVGDAEDIRQRQEEFDERGPLPKSQLQPRLTDVIEESTAVLLDVTAEDLISSKRVQGHNVTKVHAMMHSVAHFQGHVQEIICLTRQQLGEKYEFEWEPQTREEGA